MSWFGNWYVRRFLPELARVKCEALHLRRMATALAQDISLDEMAGLVAEECQKALSADAICVYLLQPDDHYEILAERGCTPAFKSEWRRISKDKLPLLNSKSLHNALFVGSAQEFKHESPISSHLVDSSGRKTVAYAPLVVNEKPIGVLGFSYNTQRECPADKSYILTMIGFCAQALQRVRLIEREHQACQQAEAANNAKTSFLANISHEIRTPIGVIQGFADLLFDSEGLSSTQRQWASVIRRNTQQLTGLIGEVLDISKIEAEKIEVDLTDFSLKELLEDVHTMAAYKAREKGVQLLFSCTDTPDFVHSDPVRLRQILTNLIGNAIKFTLQGSVEVRAKYANGSRLEIEVKDTGVGIASENQGSIFEPFIQADTSTRRHFGGTGLGLTIAKRLAQILGGDVQLRESRLGHGSTFYFFVHCEQAQSPMQNLTSPALRCGNQMGSVELAGLKVLLVEDSPDNQDLICSLLSILGASVDVADCGLAGIRTALSHDYNVVLMDIQMPGLDGHETVAILRAQGYDRPIVALTANVLSHERQKSLRQGFDDYLTKPIDRGILVRTLKRLGFSGANRGLNFGAPLATNP